MAKNYLIFLSILCEICALTLAFTYGNPVHRKPTDNCVCETFSCECCGTLLIPQIRINDTFCLSVAYLPKEYGLSLVVEVDDKVLINETISAVNPPPICLPIPYVEDFFDFCVHFTDLKISNDDFRGCASLEARMWWVYVVAELHLGCWDTGSNGGNSTAGVPVLAFGDLPKPSLKLAGDLTLTAARKFLKAKKKTSEDVLKPLKHLLNRAAPRGASPSILVVFAVLLCLLRPKIIYLRY